MKLGSWKDGEFMLKRRIIVFILVGIGVVLGIRNESKHLESLPISALDSVSFDEQIVPYNEEDLVYTTPKTSMYGAPRVTPIIPDGVILNSNMVGFIHQHEARVRPNGLDASVPWKYGTIIREEIKPNWSRVGLWGQVYLQEGYSKLPENVGIELREFKMYILNPSTLEWELILNPTFNDYNTLFYDDNFENNRYQQFYMHKKILNDGKSVVIRFDEENAMFNFHPYSNDRFEFRQTGYTMPDGRPYVICTLEARLVKWDEAGVYELEEAPFIFNVGGDYWDTYTDSWKPDWSANGEIGGGQFIEVTTKWRRAWFTNVPEELCDQLIPEMFKYPDPELN